MTNHESLLSRRDVLRLAVGAAPPVTGLTGCVGTIQRSRVRAAVAGAQRRPTPETVEKALAAVAKAAGYPRWQDLRIRYLHLTLPQQVIVKVAHPDRDDRFDAYVWNVNGLSVNPNTDERSGHFLPEDVPALLTGATALVAQIRDANSEPWAEVTVGATAPAEPGRATPAVITGTGRNPRTTQSFTFDPVTGAQVQT